jgi:hypothetical protein
VFFMAHGFCQSEHRFWWMWALWLSWTFWKTMIFCSNAMEWLRTWCPNVEMWGSSFQPCNLSRCLT